MRYVLTLMMLLVVSFVEASPAPDWVLGRTHLMYDPDQYLIGVGFSKENAVSAWRETIGATNPDEADEGTIRKLYANSLGENAVHGSDSNENAKKEIAFFFSDSELIKLK